MINATEMAKPFGKSAKDYLKTQSTKDFIYAISERRNIPLADLVSVNKGGLNLGTWMHEDVALDFAQWLSVDFKLWCNDRIKELMRTGITTTYSIDDIIANPDLIIDSLIALKKEREKVAELEKTKSYISDKKTATAMNTASKFLKENKSLKIQLDKSFEYATIKRIEIKTKRKFKWQDLRNYCNANELTMKDVHDANYGTVKAYPFDAWLNVYDINISEL